MGWINRTDVVLLSVAAYIAVMALVRLMKSRRDAVVADVQRQITTRHRQKKKQRDQQDRNAA